MIERLIQKNNGFEDDPRDDDQEIYYVGKGNDAWSLAKEYKVSKEHNIKFLLWSGELDPNLTSIQKYAAYLDELEIDHSLLVLDDVEHNPFAFYKKGGENLIRFHLED